MRCVLLFPTGGSWQRSAWDSGSRISLRVFVSWVDSGVWTAGLWIPPGAHRLEATIGRVSTSQGRNGWRQWDRCAPLLCSRRSALHCSRHLLIKAPALIPPMQLSCAVAFRSAELVLVLNWPWQWNARQVIGIIFRIYYG